MKEKGRRGREAEVIGLRSSSPPPAQGNQDLLSSDLRMRSSPSDDDILSVRVSASWRVNENQMSLLSSPSSVYYEPTECFSTLQ